MRKQMHLAQFLLHSPTYHSLAMWRHPLTDRHYDWSRPELYQHIARVCERGKFDMVFFADFVLIFYNYTRSLDPAIRYAVQTPVHDPVPLLSWMGRRHLPYRPGLDLLGEPASPLLCGAAVCHAGSLNARPGRLERGDLGQPG